MKKIQKIKPNERQFFIENDTSIKYLSDILGKALERAVKINDVMWNYNDCYDLNRARQRATDEGKNELLNSLYPEVLEALKHVTDRLPIPIHKTNPNESNIGLNVFGSMKSGDLSKGSIRDDMKKYTKFNKELNTTYFDLESMFGAGIKLAPLDAGASYSGEHMTSGYGDNYIMIDVNSLLVRMITNGYAVGENAEVSEEVLIDCIVNKIFKLYIGKAGFNKMLWEYCGDTPTMIPHIQPERAISENIFSFDNIMKSLIIYKIWYNAVNGLSEKPFEEDIDSIMDKWRIDARYFGPKEAVNNLYRETYVRIVKGLDEKLRIPDNYLEQAKHLYNVAANSYVSTLPKTSAQDRVINGAVCALGIESAVGSDLLISMGLSSAEYNRKYANVKAVNGLLGMESANISDFKDFNQYKKQTRATLLCKLSSSDRMKFIKTENDIIRMKSLAINVKNEFNQQSLLRKLSTLGKLIQVDIENAENDNNDIMIELLSLLDMERIDIMNEVSARNLVKERKTILYGMVDKTSNWDY